MTSSMRGAWRVLWSLGRTGRYDARKTDRVLRGTALTPVRDRSAGGIDTP